MLLNSKQQFNGRSDEEAIEIVTLKQSICIRMKNDAAFLIDSGIHLYEQQTTVNPNMPLRDFLYLAEECIEEGIMAEFFRENKEKVVGASIWEFDQELNDQAKYEDGFEDGEQTYIISIVCKNLAKGRDAAQIADFLEEPTEKIEAICAIAKNFAPEYDVEAICREWQENKGKTYR